MTMRKPPILPIKMTCELLSGLLPDKGQPQHAGNKLLTFAYSTVRLLGGLCRTDPQFRS